MTKFITNDYLINKNLTNVGIVTIEMHGSTLSSSVLPSYHNRFKKLTFSTRRKE